MTQPIRLLDKYLHNSFTVTIALIWLIFSPTGLLATENKPQDPPPKTTGASGGSRAYEKVVFNDR